MKVTFTKLQKQLFVLLLFFVGINRAAIAQTTLVAGDLTFSGYISNDPSLADQFSFVLLKNVAANTVIKFTDFGWRTDLNAFSSGSNVESEITFTTNAAFVAGTEITIANNALIATSTSAKLVGGASAGSTCGTYYRY